MSNEETSNQSLRERFLSCPVMSHSLNATVSKLSAIMLMGSSPDVILSQMV